MMIPPSAESCLSVIGGFFLGSIVGRPPRGWLLSLASARGLFAMLSPSSGVVRAVLDVLKAKAANADDEHYNFHGHHLLFLIFCASLTRTTPSYNPSA